MISDSESEADINSGIQKTLISINDITLKIKKELNMIDELVKENGLLQTVVGTANETLSKKVHEMGMNVAEIIDEGRRNDRLESNFLDSVMSNNIVVTEKLLEYMNP